MRTQFRNVPGFFDYLGNLDIELVEPPSFRSFLYIVQNTMNEALRSEGVNASGGVAHPPFHFDYLDVIGQIANAHAFQHADFSFIVVTLPMVALLWDVSQRLSRLPLIAKQLRLDFETVDPDALHGLLFQIQLDFLVSHEYTHRIHRHCVESRHEAISIWTEFRPDTAGSDISSQTEELDADSYAAYLVLAHLQRGGRRETALAALGAEDLPDVEGDELLLTCFFLAVLAFLCAFWRGEIDVESIYQFRHPPPPVRIKYVIQVAEMWCGQNGSVPQSWFSPSRFQELFRAAAQLIVESTRQTWDAQMAFLRGSEGSRYDGQLFESFEALRQKRHAR